VEKERGQVPWGRHNDRVQKHDGSGEASGLAGIIGRKLIQTTREKVTGEVTEKKGFERQKTLQSDICIESKDST